MNKRQQILFDDILESLWSQAYVEIVSIVKEQNLIGKIISINCNNLGIIGVFVDDYLTLNFLDRFQTLRIAEEYSDSTMFEIYKILFEHYYK